MEEILILTSTFLPNPGANGLITYKIAKELRDRGYILHVIAVKNSLREMDEDNIEDINIRRITKSNYSFLIDQHKNNKEKKKKVVFQRRLKNVLYLKDFPNFDKQQTIKVIRAAENIIKKNNITKIIAIQKPYANIDAVIELKEKYPERQTFAIFLDPIDSIDKPNAIPKKLYDLLIKRAIEKVSRSIDIVFQPENKKISFLDNENIKNFKYYEYPSFSLSGEVNSGPSYKNKIDIIYAGTLDKEYRNPDTFFKVIHKLSKKKAIKTTIYGKNVDVLSKSVNNISVDFGGAINQEELFLQYSKSDLLINISNKGIDSIPSKIFELFSFGKPIINFVKETNDPSLKYFEKYPLSFNFYEFKSFGPQMELLLLFLDDNLGKNVDKKRLVEVFKKNTIQYFVDQLENNFL